VPIERKLEQKLWDAFRQPIDDAFERKSKEREKAEQELNARDKVVLDAAKALETANASADAQAIRAAMAALELALKGHEESVVVVPASEPAAVAVTPSPAKPLIAMRGDDRPGMKKEAAPVMPAGRAPKRPDRKESPRPATPVAAMPARLGDVAFRAQRDALDNAQAAFRKLAAQAHGESLTQLMTSWEQRDAGKMPSVQELGARVSASVRSTWAQALAGATDAVKSTSVQDALLRLEMAAEVPTPAEHLNARRALQLQLLTKRNAPAPAQTWGQDVAAVMSGVFANEDARRLQNVLKVLLKR
jgi:hypothetical protein